MSHDSTDLVRLPELLASLPNPADLKAALKHRLEQGFAAAKAQRGAVHVPEDTFELQRSLAAVLELTREYERAFAALRRTVTQMQEEELVDAVGEQAGAPNQGLTVPDPEGDIRLSVANENTHTIDGEALVDVVASEILTTDGDMAGVSSGLDTEDFHAILAAAIRRFLELGKFEPQVSKVKAYGKALARNGEDHLASVVGTTIRTTSTYKGVAFERKKP